MLQRLKVFIDNLSGPETERVDLEGEELKLAAAALLVHTTHVDGQIDISENAKLRTLLEKHFDLSPEKTEELIWLAKKEDRDAVDLYGFTSVLTRHLDQDGRQKIVGMLWQIVFADGIVHEFEDNLVWRVAELLGVSTRDRLRLKKQFATGQDSSEQ